MKFKGDVVGSAWARVGAVLVAASLLVSCGGGTQIDAFVPKRVLAFGDEASAINSDGSKYGINTLIYDTTASPPVPVVPNRLDCQTYQNWSQSVASGYGMVFPECNPLAVSTTSRVLAHAGDTVSGVSQQVTDFLSGDSFAANDLVTVMAGANDVMTQYQLYKSGQISQNDALNAVGQAGTDLGSVVVRITDLGAKVLIATLPDLGLSPFARATDAEPTVLTALTKNFNKTLGLRLEDVKNGGRSAGLIQAYDIVLNIYQNPTAYGLTNIVEPACLPANTSTPGTLSSLTALSTCTVLTLQPTGAISDVPTSLPATATTWMWADSTHYGPSIQSQLGSAALSRARGNPF